TLVALLAKESALALVPAVLLYDVVVPPKPGRRVRAEHLVVGVLLLGYLAARWWVDRIGFPPEDILPIDNPIVEAPFLAGRLTAIGVLVREAALVAWPATLSTDYSYRQIPVVTLPPSTAADWMPILMLPVLVAAARGIVRLRRRSPACALLLAFAAVA